MEMCQYIFRPGATDITDVITNTLGTITGIVLYVLLLSTRYRKTRTKGVKSDGPILLLIFFPNNVDDNENTKHWWQQ